MSRKMHGFTRFFKRISFFLPMVLSRFQTIPQTRSFTGTLYLTGPRLKLCLYISSIDYRIVMCWRVHLMAAIC